MKLVHNNPKPEGVSRSRRRITRQREPVLRRLGFCLRVIVEEFHPNLELSYLN